jgi:hypothetical protein
MIAVLDWFGAHWFWIFLLAILGVFDWMRDFCVDVARAAANIGERRHKRRMKELRLQAKIAAGEKTLTVKPGHCVHRNVVPVIAADETLTAWLCRTCDTQLPVDWAVREEDL